MTTYSAETLPGQDSLIHMDGLLSSNIFHVTHETIQLSEKSLTIKHFDTSYSMRFHLTEVSFVLLHTIVFHRILG